MARIEKKVERKQKLQHGLGGITMLEGFDLSEVLNGIIDQLLAAITAQITELINGLFSGLLG